MAADDCAGFPAFAVLVRDGAARAKMWHIFGIIVPRGGAFAGALDVKRVSHTRSHRSLGLVYLQLALDLASHRALRRPCNFMNNATRLAT
jgi:hypothetical protein